MKPVLPDNLSDLKEFNDLISVTLSNGHTIQYRIVPELEACEVTGDMPICFTDSDGAWAIDYHLKGGPYKRRMWL